jgi:DNA uptake protein ComE-like DNA-binding protein
MEVDGMDAARFEMMEPQIEINYALIRKIDLKTADQSLLGQHPYIGPYAARWIVHYREQLGDTVCTLPSLLRRNIIKPQQAQWLEYYVE